MLGRLRRLRSVSALLLALSPVVGVVVLPVLHPCPVDLPWVATTTQEGHGHHGESPTESDSSHTCHCVGACVTAALHSTVSAADLVGRRAAVVLAPRSPLRSATLVSLRESHVLPPAHAPPSV